MRDPTQFNSALIYSHAFTMSVYLIAGGVCYFGWGYGVLKTPLILQAMCDYPGCANQLMPHYMPDGSVETIFIDEGNPLPADFSGLPGNQWWVGYVLGVAVCISLSVTLPLTSFCFMSSFSAMSKTIRDSFIIQLAIRIAAAVVGALVAGG